MPKGGLGPPIPSREVEDIKEFEVFTYSVYNALGVGYERAVTRKELCSRLKCGDRRLREAIEVLRKEYPILTRDDGKGYYIPPPTPEGRNEAAVWLKKQDKRIKSIKTGQKGARRFAFGTEYKQIYGTRNKNIPGQLKMFGVAGGG